MNLFYYLCWTSPGRWSQYWDSPPHTARILHFWGPPRGSAPQCTLSDTRPHPHPGCCRRRNPTEIFSFLAFTQFSYLMAVIIDPKLVLISTLTISQRILSLVAEVDGWRRGHGGVVRVRVAAHLESSRTPSIINTTHPVMGDSVDVDNFAFCTSLLYMGSIFKTHPEKGENKKWDIIVVLLCEICECLTLQECSHGLSSLVLHTHSLQ